MEATLNNNDLLELGYKLVADIKIMLTNKFYYRKEDSEYEILLIFSSYKEGHPTVIISKITDNLFNTIFDGKIKNKTELSKVLEQVTA